MKLIIVESPAKGKTIQRFVGKGYLVKPSFGHIRDLPEKELGVDIKNNFKPHYIVLPKAKKNIKEIKNALAKSEKVILATDEDREGESIAWHLVETLKPEKPYERIVFHEITRQAIESALKNPRNIDMNLVNAQQARRILDRIVGYKLSPFLWKKVTKGLSAGRVQSVAVRLVVEREKEIENFKPQEYWTIEALLQKIQQNASKSKNEFAASLTKINGKTIPKPGIKSKKEVEKIIQDLKDAEYKVLSVEKKEVKRNPLPPFTTSTLQQEAWKRFGFSAKLTMSIAQNLYEKGYITYHRTDSLNLSSQSQEAAKRIIEKTFGKEYWPGYKRTYKTKSKLSQEAHEAIRPTYPERTPETLKERDSQLTTRHLKLYELIWQRFIASQMKEALLENSQAEIAAKNYIFKATGQIIKFDGFLRVYPIKTQEETLPFLKKGEILTLKRLIPSQHFTQPPARYSEATLIKALEKEGIGRPSTYAPILDTIQKRNYVQKDKNKKLKPTPIAMIVNDILTTHFPAIVDIKFTAKMEENLDKIAQGKKNWIETLKEFYGPFEENLEKKYKEVSKEDLIEKTDKICKKCGSPMVIRWSRYGKFYACSNFPKCTYTEPLAETKLNIPCPKCKKGEIIEKRTKKGRVFYACSLYPKCSFALWEKPIAQFCPKCNSILVEKNKNLIKCSNKNCDYEKRVKQRN